MKVNKLREIRRKLDISQYELSRRCGIVQPTLSLIEKYYKSPNDEQKRKIALALHSPIEAIFPENDLGVTSNE